MWIDFPYAATGAFTGLVIGLTGVGGGALMAPILLLVFGMAPATVVAVDLWFAAITKAVGGAIHYRGGNVDWQIVKRLWLGSLPVAAAITALVAFEPDLTKVRWLTQAIGWLILVTAIGLLVAPKLSAIARGRRIEHPAAFKRVQPELTVLAGAVLGICVALTSVGAGALGSLMLLYLYPLRMTPHKLVATEIVNSVPLAALAGVGYLAGGKVDFHILTSLLAGSIPAVICGSLLAGKFSARWLQVALACILFIVAVRIVC